MIKTMINFFQDSTILENCWKYFVLGVIQGITEFLPISSTAHLKALPLILGWDDPGVSVSAAIQLGSIIAVIIYFKNDLSKILQGIFQSLINTESRTIQSQMGLSLCLGTIPILIAGLGIKLFWTNFENSSFRSTPSIALISIVMALLLVYAEKIGKRKKSLNEMQGKDGFIIGVGQMFALIPGVSRSGITLTTALAYGFKRQDAAKFSFLLGIPSISIAGLIEIDNAFKANSGDGYIPLFIGILTSTFVSWLAIDWLIKYLQKNNTNIFIFYRLVFGIGLLSWWSNTL